MIDKWVNNCLNEMIDKWVNNYLKNKYTVCTGNVTVKNNLISMRFAVRMQTACFENVTIKNNLICKK